MVQYPCHVLVCIELTKQTDHVVASGCQVLDSLPSLNPIEFCGSRKVAGHEVLKPILSGCIADKMGLLERANRVGLLGRLMQ